mmetsp:Transcript_39346/g.93230  ORF Transcript_39346/g.93230 Transcript_39346/m.93230 type:complete len:127 (+) Transcript_39346:140-520(+)
MAEGEESGAQLESKHLGELQENKNELLLRVQSLKKELSDWRSKLDAQVKTYKNELGELRTALNQEVEQLRSVRAFAWQLPFLCPQSCKVRLDCCSMQEFQDLRTTLRQQLEATSDLAAGGEGESHE